MEPAYTPRASTEEIAAAQRRLNERDAAGFCRCSQCPHKAVEGHVLCVRHGGTPGRYTPETRPPVKTVTDVVRIPASDVVRDEYGNVFIPIQSLLKACGPADQKPEVAVTIPDSCFEDLPRRINEAAADFAEKVGAVASKALAEGVDYALCADVPHVIEGTER